MNVLNFATSDVVTVGPDESIDKAISLMEERSLHHLVVVDKGHTPLGVLSDRDILISTGWRLSAERRAKNRYFGGRTLGPTRIEQIMSRPVVSLPEAATARQAATMMRDRKIGAIPIVCDGKLSGIVTVHDLISWLDELAVDGSAAARLLEAPVRDRMSSPVLTVAPDSMLDEVVALFQRFNIHHVPVAVLGRLSGIVSDRDVRRSLGWSTICDQQAEAESILPSVDFPMKASEVMSRDVMTTAPHAPLRQALRRMVFHRIHSLPVVQIDQLVGILTPTDFVKAIAEEELL